MISDVISSRTRFKSKVKVSKTYKKLKSQILLRFCWQRCETTPSMFGYEIYDAPYLKVYLK